MIGRWFISLYIKRSLLKRVDVPKVLARLCIAWIVRPDAHNETGLGWKWSAKSNRKKRFPQNLESHHVFELPCCITFGECTNTCRRERRPVIRFQLPWQNKTFQGIGLCSFSFLSTYNVYSRHLQTLNLLSFQKNQFKQMLYSSALINFKSYNSTVPQKKHLFQTTSKCFFQGQDGVLDGDARDYCLQDGPNRELQKRRTGAGPWLFKRENEILPQFW